MLLGVGVGMLVPAARRLVIVSDPDNVGKNIGTMGAFDVGGFLVGPLLAGVLAEFYGYRAPFIVLAVITAALRPEHRPPAGGPWRCHRGAARGAGAARPTRACVRS